jgi:NAD(P)-dependent dehydrogenase (short-subunit alcohol dehydrogenase family)
VSPLAGQVAVVTGASRGIGAATAAALAAAGAQVIGISRSMPGRADSGIIGIPCDLTDTAAWNAVAARLLAEFGAPHIVVSNAGAFVMQPFSTTSQSEFDSQLDANLRAPFAVARALLPGMKAAGRGTFVHVGSIADHLALPGNAAYAASKFGLRGLHEVIAAEYRGTGVRLTLVSPGATDTAIWDAVDPDRQPHLPNRAEMLSADEVAEAILFVVTRPPRVQVDWLQLGAT